MAKSAQIAAEAHLRAMRATRPGSSEAMIAAGRDYIQEMGGLSVSLEHLSYEDILARSGVSRSSVYRVWQYKEDYFAEMVPALARFEWMTGADPSHQEAMLDGLDELANQGESLADPEFRDAFDHPDHHVAGAGHHEGEIGDLPQQARRRFP